MPCLLPTFKQQMLLCIPNQSRALLPQGAWGLPVLRLAAVGMDQYAAVPGVVFFSGLQGDVCANSARHLAAEFNGALMKSGTTAQLSYQEVSILLLPDPSAPSGKKVLFMEPYLEGG